MEWEGLLSLLTRLAPLCAAEARHVKPLILQLWHLELQAAAEVHGEAVKLRQLELRAVAQVHRMAAELGQLEHQAAAEVHRVRFSVTMRFSWAGNSLLGCLHDGRRKKKFRACKEELRAEFSKQLADFENIYSFTNFIF